MRNQSQQKTEQVYNSPLEHNKNFIVRELLINLENIKDHTKEHYKKDIALESYNNEPWTPQPQKKQANTSDDSNFYANHVININQHA